MGSQKIGIDIEVSDNNSTAKMIKSVDQLDTRLKQTQKTAAALNTGSTQGSRVAAAAATSSGAMGTQQYGALRGSAGATGASARDFAQEAQGLGGLVRLYATYAANIFAVGAAFRALSDAMDTSNMIKGLNQLGASTGQNLGGMAKRITEITDGAISLRESMTAVAQSSSAGISSKNIERMAAVAKAASTALGVSMTDALSRLSRGVTKLEPELLDELGIMTKIGPAVDTYAKAVGKSAAQLTDFERRQAFANAVLTEGESKFGLLADAAVNPYNKLLATLKNVAQGGLEIVNKVLTPAIDLLSSNPTALIAVLGALGVSLVKQALPAIGQFKAGLAAAAESAAMVSLKRADDAASARAKLDKQITDEVEHRADKQIAAVDKAEQNILRLQKGSINKQSAAYKILQKDISEVSKEDFKRLESSAKGLETRGLTQQAAAYREIGTAIKESQAAEQDLINIKQKQQVEVQKELASKTSIYGITQNLAKTADIDSQKKRIISNAAYNSSLIGIGNAYKLMNAEIESSGLKLTNFQSGMLKARAGVGIFIGAISSIGIAINSALGVIGLILAVISILDTVFTKNAKEISAFNQSLDDMSESAASAGRGLDFLDKKGGYASATIEGINAMSNATNDLAKSTESSVDAAIKAKETLGVYGKLKNLVADFFDGGIDKNLAAGMTKDIEAALKTLTRSGLGAEAEAAFKDVLHVTSLDTGSVEKALNSLSDTAKVKVSEALTKLGVELGNSASRLQGFKSASDSTTKAYQEFIQSTANTNPIFKVGASLESLGESMAKLKTGGIDEVNAAFIDLAKSPEKAALFGSEFVGQLVSVRKEFLDQTEAITVYKNHLKDLDKQIAATAGEYAIAGSVYDRYTLGSKLQSLKQDKKVIENTINLLPTDKIDAAKQLFAKGISYAFAEGSRLINVGLGQAAEKAGISIAKAQLAGLTGENKAIKEGQVAQQELRIQERAIDTNIDLILSQQRLTAAVEESTAVANLATARSSGKSDKEIANLEIGAKAATMLKEMLGNDKTGIPKIDVSKLPVEVQGKALAIRQSLASQQATKIELGGTKSAQALNTDMARGAGRVQDQQKILEQENQINQLQQTRLGIVSNISGVMTEQSIVQENMYTRQLLNNKQELELLNIDNAIRDAKLAKDPDEIKKQELRKQGILNGQQLEQDNLTLQGKQKLLTRELDIIARRYDLEKSTTELNNIRKNSQLEINTAELNAYTSLYGIVETYSITQTALLEKEKAAVDAAKAKNDAQVVYNKLLDESAAKISLLDQTKDAGQINEINNKLTEQKTILDNTLLGIQVQLDTKTKILDITKQTNLEQAKYNEITQTSVTLAESLGIVFGSIGDAVGGLTKSFADFTVSSEKGAGALKTIQDNLKNTVAFSDEYNTLKEEEGKQLKRNQKTELTGYAQIAGSAKKMFAEKTFAYKALDKIEKAMHFARLAMDIEEMISKVTALTVGTAATATATATDTAIVNAGFISRIPAYIGEIFGSIVAQVGIPGIAIAAGLVAALFGAFGGGGGSAAFVPTSAQRQETQGTAMSYSSEGTKVQTRAGVFGDTGAKSESIAKSLEVIKNTSVIGLSYDNKMLNALNKVADALLGTAKAVYRIPGIATGSLTGTTEGTNTSGGLFGISGLFGKSTTKDIIDSGIKLSGTFKQLADGVDGTISAFETISTTVTKNGFLGIGSSTNTSVGTNVVGVSQTAQDAITGAFAYGEQLLNSIGSLAGISKDTISTALSGVRVDELASLRGLTGDAFSAQLSAVIGAVFDDAANAIFGQFAQYAKFGEGMLETVVRVTDTNTKINQALSNMGNKTAKLGSAFGITEALAKAAGGLQNFVDQSTFFSENFLTEADRLAPVQKAVTDEMGKLGFGSVKTRAEFKKLVQVLDLTTNTGQDTYQALMNVQEGFSKLYPVVDKTLEAETALKIVYENRKKELADLVSGFTTVAATLKDLKASLLQGSESILTPAQKYALAKREFTDTLALTKADDPKVRLTALQKLSQTSKDFLAVSKVAYGSSIKYTEDFNSVLNALDLAGTAATQGINTATQQLSELQTMVGLLTTLDKSASTSTDIQDAIKSFFETKFSTELSSGMLAAVTSALGANSTAADVKALSDRVDLLIKALNDPKDTKVAAATEQALQAYASLGKNGTGTGANQVDKAGLDYWVAQLVTGMVKSEDLNNIFKQADPMRYQVTQAYANIGRTGSQVDTEGFNYWISQLMTGALTSDSFNTVFAEAAKRANMEALVKGAYAGIGRTGTGTEAGQIDQGGFDYWMSNLMTGALDASKFNSVFSSSVDLSKLATTTVVTDALDKINTYVVDDTLSINNQLVLGNQKTQQLVDEIVNLREEVAGLRSDQNQQTGAIITSNYDANQINAEVITTVATETAKNTNWKLKLQNDIYE